ncbi:hypothetical protein CK203_020029 [Vitis vinifera]|uniref:Uncharacterized protein n=1 Tax=Vitis vinifera TaxID=29760 RepID=A0A438J2V7_VITVI|nr:hypothetical protein CK203_020029 [Vitis vinifera]
MTVTPLEWVLGRDRVDIMPQEEQLLHKTVRLMIDVPPVELNAKLRAVGTNVQGQSSSSRGSSFDDFKKLGPPYFSGATDPTEAEAWILKMENSLVS